MYTVVMITPIENLEAAKAGLLEQRAGIDRTLELLEEMLSNLSVGDTSSNVPTVSTDAAPQAATPTPSNNQPATTQTPTTPTAPTAEPAAKPARKPRGRPAASGGPTLRSVIEEYMPYDIPMHTSEIYELVLSHGLETTPGSVRGQTHKFATTGLLEKTDQPATFIRPSHENGAE